MNSPAARPISERGSGCRSGANGPPSEHRRFEGSHSSGRCAALPRSSIYRLVRCPSAGATGSAIALAAAAVERGGRPGTHGLDHARPWTVTGLRLPVQDVHSQEPLRLFTAASAGGSDSIGLWPSHTVVRQIMDGPPAGWRGNGAVRLSRTPASAAQSRLREHERSNLVGGEHPHQ